jgi:very-short-patch-repair endonuclease
VAKTKGWRPINDAEKQEIIRRYLAGERLVALADDCHRGKEAIRQVLEEAGIEIRSRSSYIKGTTWTPERRTNHMRTFSTPEFAQKSRENLLKRLPAMRGPATNTAIERRLHDALMEAGIGFTAQSLLLERYLVDIEIRQAPIVIEADGAQHTLRLQKAKDALRDGELTVAGYQIFRFTGSEINTDAVACVRRVIDACGLTPDEEPVYEIRTKFAGELHPNWKGGQREFTCEQCGKAFFAQPTHRRGPHYYCTIQCANAAKRGKPLSAETRAKIGAKHLGTKRGPMSAETKAKLGASVSAALKGKPKSAEHAAKVAAANRGRPKSAETKAKISASLKRRNASQIKM